MQRVYQWGRGGYWGFVLYPFGTNEKGGSWSKRGGQHSWGRIVWFTNSTIESELNEHCILITYLTCGLPQSSGRLSADLPGGLGGSQSEPPNSHTLRQCKSKRSETGIKRSLRPLNRRAVPLNSLNFVLVTIAISLCSLELPTRIFSPSQLMCIKVSTRTPRRHI
jgi:hypothetical protein